MTILLVGAVWLLLSVASTVAVATLCAAGRDEELRRRVRPSA